MHHTVRGEYPTQSLLIGSTDVAMHPVKSPGSMQGSTMQPLTKKLPFAAAWFFAAVSLAVGAPAKQAEKAACIGEPVALVILPETICLAGPRSMRQVLVTGQYSDGSERDLTSFCEFRLE